MSRLYASPLRVYLCLAALAIAGLVSGARLPVSLFPNTAKPNIVVNVSYGGGTAGDFLQAYGRALEEQLRAVSSETLEVQAFKANYGSSRANYTLEFRWGNSPTEALKEVQLVANSFASRLPTEIRESLGVWTNNENSGFLAVSFYSATRSLDELYDLLEPTLVPPLSRVKDAAEADLWNPSRKEIQIELDPEKMAALQLFPRDVERAISGTMSGFGGGSVTVGLRNLGIEIARPVNGLADLSRIIVTTRGGRIVHLSDIAKIDFAAAGKNARSFKTSGAPSLILFATPKAGGNVKRMSEEILAIIGQTMPSLPKDVEFRVLVDPSEFIRASIRNVLHEVALGALLAVAILFLFIGSFRNTVTAAIEIPLSMILAFILMRLSDMNLNLISLGGLALSAGMNVDASVVVMENIFRRFEGVTGKLPFQERLRLVSEAVAEVRFPVIASTLASLVVFLPLAFTSELSYAILGDLAKTVVFSHGFSALVALILVPTVRLQLLARGDDNAAHSPIEPWIKRFENRYGELLAAFIDSGRRKIVVYSGLAALLAVLAFAVLPRLPKEIIGTPDTDWMVLAISTQGNSFVRQMESQTEEIETALLKEFGEKIQYTFTQVQSADHSNIMARLKRKKDMRALWKSMEERFVNTPFVRYWVGPWNPAELPIPNPPELRIALRGGTLEERAEATDSLQTLLQEKQVLPRIWTRPGVSHTESIVLRPGAEQWAALRAQEGGLHPGDLADLARVATEGKRVGSLLIAGKESSLFLRYPEGLIATPEALGAFPVGIASRIVPLKALARVQVETVPPTIYREDGRELFLIEGKQNESSEGKGDKAFLTKARALVAQWAQGKKITPQFEDAEKDLNEALRQLGIAVALSVLLIFLTLLIQFGDVMSAALVLVAVPLGFIGVLISLFAFQSSLSLNSVLGVILLNGLAVANSIILVDFLKRRVEAGLSPRDAAIQAARQRLRPILITSLTTVLGMLPVALGMGEGGRILQPLGIAVTGGLWVSMSLTLFVVPALQVSYLDWKRRRGHGFRVLPSFLLCVGLSLLAPMRSPLAAETPASPPARLSFDQALERILSRSTRIGIGELELAEGQARNLPSRLHFLPSISLGAKQSTSSIGTGTDSSRTSSRSIEADATINLFRFGADAAASKAAIHEETALRQQADSARLEAEAEAAAALLQVIRRSQEIQILTRLAKMEEDSVRIARERYARGLLPLQEVEKVSIDLENARARLSDGEVRAAEASARLVALLGQADLDHDWPWINRLKQGSFDSLLGAPSGVPLQHPRVRAAASRAQAEEELLSRQYRLLLPSLDASLVYGYYEPKAQASYPAWTGVLTLSLPVFDRLAGISRTKALARSREAALLRLEQSQRDALETWEAVTQGFRAARSSALAREKTLLTTRKLYEDGLKRFQQGRMTTNELFVEQSRLSETEFLAVESWSAAHLALTRLCHTLGKRLAGCLTELN
ncbi:MAG: efflux RND transporter permease subunit [Oligoflexia bacterium]|nr:efflux RND transporter permease subunit [Oligoflexia bacterium]